MSSANKYSPPTLPALSGHAGNLFDALRRMSGIISRQVPTSVKLAAIAVAVGLPAVLAGCSNSPTTPLAKVSKEITSGVVPGGQRALFFLTRPMDRRKFSGSFDASLQPQVLVCTAVPCISPILGPIGLGSTGAATLTLDTVHQSYVFRWRTRDAQLAPDAVYRLVVRVGDYQLGWVDLATGAKQRDLRAFSRREFLPVRLGSTVTLPFRIEQGAPFPPDLPGRYESACPSPYGCFIHADPITETVAIWSAVQITQTGGVKTGIILFSYPLESTEPVLPPIPAPGTGPLNGVPSWVGSDLTMLSWRFAEDDPECLELYSEGLFWGHWCGTFGGSATLSSSYPPWDAFPALQRLPNYLPPIE